MDREQEGTDGQVFGVRTGGGSTTLRLQHYIAFGWLWFSALLLMYVGWSSRKRHDREYMKDKSPGPSTQRKYLGRSRQGEVNTHRRPKDGYKHRGWASQHWAGGGWVEDASRRVQMAKYLAQGLGVVPQEVNSHRRPNDRYKHRGWASQHWVGGGWVEDAV
ncbi:hypothetical protein T07_2485 [Trichinella nelsoni]|uniref:Uncharacterized protein n=1 Tax=Trichinella nelsoni TaxID=6336 RepID=A0A0V0RH45_9BILA|nr:hypothetical protein T07_2485 [Trichinella nelsoni]